MTPEPRRCPSYTTRFVGRRDDVRALARALGPGAVVGLTGPGGVGKTRLAAEALRGQRAAFVDASTARDGDALVRCVLRDLGGTAHALDDAEPAQVALDRLAAVPVVVFDNLEQLGAGAAGLLARVAGLPRPPAVVYTSRVAVGAEREVLLPVGPLTRDEDLRDVLTGAAPATAVFDDDTAVLKVARSADGLPLALELAAGRLAVLPLAEVVERLEHHRLALLRDPGRAGGRATALDRSVAWTWELLAPEVRAAATQLAVFAGPFDAATAEEVLGAPLAEPLAALVRWHLLRLDDGRYVPYEGVRAFVAGVLAAEPDRARVTERHAEVFLRRAKGASLPALFADSAEHDAVVELGLAPGAPPRALELARRLARDLYRLDAARRTSQDHAALLGRLVDAGPEDATVLPLLAAQARMAYHHDRAGSRACAERLLAGATRFGDVRFEGSALVSLAQDAADRGAHGEAAAWTERGLALARAHGQRVLEAILLAGPVNTGPMADGRFDEVRARMSAGVAIADTLDPYQGYSARINLLALELAAGGWPAAEGLVARLRELEQAAPIPWVAVQYRVQQELMAWFGRDGPAALPHLEHVAAELPPQASAAVSATAALVLALARRLASGTPVDTALDALPAPDRAVAERVRWAARALDGPPGPAPTVPDDPASQAVARLTTRIVARAAGERPPETPIGPSSAWLHAASWVAKATRRFTVADDGAWFQSPDGPRVPLGDRQARLVRALVRGPADVGALFAAGWPGTHIAAASQANRVRVALTALRRLGLPIRWTRGVGYTLER